MKDMVDILTHIHQYVPQVEYEKLVAVDLPSTNELENATVYKALTHPILLGGDQLSQARARTALKVKCNGERPSSRLEGFILTIEDWHAKLCLFQVCMISLLDKFHFLCIHRLYGNILCLKSQGVNTELPTKLET